MPSADEIEAAQAAVLVGTRLPRHRIEAQVRERMAEGRELPVEHRDHARLVGANIRLPIR
jgi:hypothetical protein